MYRDSKKGIELLLVRPFEDRDVWGIPKGHIGPGETVEQCAMREVKEETGFDVLLEDRLTIVYTRYGDTRKKLYAFLARRVGGKLGNRDAENVDVKWFPATALPQLHYYQQPLIVEALKILSQRICTEVPAEVATALEHVYGYAGPITQWITLKKEILRILHPRFRTLFSTRDPLTKRQRTNEFERRVAEAWSELARCSVVFTIDDESQSRRDCSPAHTQDPS